MDLDFVGIAIIGSVKDEVLNDCGKVTPVRSSGYRRAPSQELLVIELGVRLSLESIVYRLPDTLMLCG